MNVFSRARPVLIMLTLVMLAACGAKEDPNAPLVPMGDFRLGYAVVVDKNAQIGPLSRKAPPGAWKESLSQAIKDRLGKYEGDRLYHIGVNIDGYVLAIPGVPLVISPKSVLVASVTVWDDAKQVKLNPKPEQLTVLESFSPETLIGSGLTQNKKHQMANLSRNMARAIQRYLLRHPEWFGLPPLPPKPERPEAGSHGNN